MDPDSADISEKQPLSPEPTSGSKDDSPQVDGQFIFREDEFENDDFNAAQFVGKYRRVSSLDSLRDQLQEYCQNLKDQLYVILNRDYKDFITIATKLDGVDDRVDHLRQPLVDLRMSLSALFDGMVASKQAIQEKFRHKAEIGNRRRLLESSLLCLSQVELAEEVLNTNIPTQILESDTGPDFINASGSGKRRRELMRVLHLTEKGKKTSPISSARARALFECSEYERAANSLSVAMKCIDSIKTMSSGGTSSSSSTAMAAMAAFAKSIEQRVRKATEALVARIRNRLEDMLTVAFSASTRAKERIKSSSDENSPADVASGDSLERIEFPERPYSHCLRALISLNRGDIAEKVVADAIVLPLAKTVLTQGRVDGTGGRGSFAGLRQSLDIILSDLRTYMIEPFQIAESVVHSVVGLVSGEAHIPLDLIISGVWAPVVAHLAEKFSSMFSVGIANTFYTAYVAVEGFTTDLALLLQTEVNIVTSEKITSRLRSHPALLTFHGKWKLDIYYQLRSQEINSRLEKGCSSLLSPQGFGKGSSDAVYDAPGNSLEKDDMTKLQAMVGIDRYQLVSSRVLLIELMTCLHEKVILPAQGARFLGMAVQLILKMQTVIATIVNGTAIVPTQIHPVHASASVDVASTPLKSGAAPGAATPVTPSVNAPQALSFSNEDLIALTSDLDLISNWIEDFFVTYCQRCTAFNDDASSLISRLFKTQATGVHKQMLHVFNKINQQLSNECKSSLQAVRAVAGKYRMTNKPPPESASPYVKTVLQPLRLFVDKNSNLIPVSVPDSWITECVEQVTATYLQQVKELMETAKQMDSALQRRSKLRSTNTAVGAVGTAGASDKVVLGDSEKISLQILLDVIAFGDEIRRFDVDPETSISYRGLLDEVAEARPLLSSGGPTK